MANIDYVEARWASAFYQQHPSLGATADAMMTYDTFKMFPIVALLAVTCVTADKRSEAERVALTGVLGNIFALVITHTIEWLMPARPRPAFAPGLSFGASNYMTPDWSSFPSDTVAMAVALACAVCLYSRIAGTLAFSWALLLATAKLIGGFHYFSDVVVGAAIGIGSTLMVARTPTSFNAIVTALDRLVAAAPALVWFLAFLTMFESSIMFDDVRKTGHDVLKAVGVTYNRHAPPKASRAGGSLL